MIRLNLDQLHTFLIVVRSGGVVKAAQSLNLTQPAVTARIKGLERTLGADIFDRSSGQTRLTKRGEMLMQYALRMEALTDQIERDIAAPEGIEGHLRIGASETIAQSWMHTFIAELYRRFPSLQIEFNVDVSVNLRNALVDREIDLAFLLGPVSEYSVDNVTLPSFQLAWYAPSDAPRDSGAEAMLYGKPVITYARNTRPYREIRETVSERVGPDVRLFPSSSLSAAMRLVAMGLGVSALPRALADPLVDEGKLRRFDPGWTPEPLTFTASYVAEPPSRMIATAAQIAAAVAEAHATSEQGNKNF